MSQNFDGVLASPGNRHARPTTAIGMSLAIFGEDIFASAEDIELPHGLPANGKKRDRELLNGFVRHQSRRTAYFTLSVPDMHPA